MSAARRLRRRSRIVHDPIVKARIAVSMARGLTLREAADHHTVPERSARNWTHEHHWERWIELARDAIARSPLQRDDAVAQYLIDELHRGNVDERPKITRAYVEDLKAKALAITGLIGEKFWDGAPAEAVAAWIARRYADGIGSATLPATLEGQGDFWGTAYLRAISTFENIKCYAATGDGPPRCPPSTRPHDLNPNDQLEATSS